MALASTALAYLTARSGAGRSGAMRSGFIPTETEGATPGSVGPRYVWREEAEVSTTWTEVNP